MELTDISTGRDLVERLHQEAFSQDHAKAQEHVFKTLSKINVNEHTEEKNGLTYLSWAWAYQTMMEHFPTFDYFFHGVNGYPDDTMEVHCTAWLIHDGQLVARYMWLPVMNYANKAIQSPNAVDINKAKMRCLTKAISMFGLGAYIYAGEDLPQPERTKEEDKPKTAPKKTAPKKTAAKKATTKKEETGEESPWVDVLISSEEDAGLFVDSCILWVRKHETLKGLVSFWNSNEANITILKNDYPTDYERLKTAFTTAKGKLS